jgi:hypothetical protein
MKTYSQFMNEGVTGDGLYTFRKPSLSSIEIIEEWIQENRIPNPIAAKDLHVTIVCSDANVPNYKLDSRPVWINPATYNVDVLGEALVLRFKSDVLTQQWTQAKALGAESKWPTYQPHLSLSYSVPDDYDHSGVKPLPVQIILDQEQSRPIIDGWAAINHLREYTIGDMTLGGGPVFQSSPDLSKQPIPQVRNADIPEFVVWLERQGIHVNFLKMAVSELRPIGTTASAVRTIPDATLIQPLIASKDNYILDSQQRWQTLLNRDPHYKINTYQVDLPIGELLAIAHGFPKTSY